MRLKIEINTREHFSELGLISLPYSVESRWFTRRAEVTTYRMSELLGTKLRALFQRKKGRDLFDLWHAIESGAVDTEEVISCFLRYTADAATPVTRARFEENMSGKSGMQEFRGDIRPLLAPEVSWSFDEAYRVVMQQLVAAVPGEPWKKI